MAQRVGAGRAGAARVERRAVSSARNDCANASSESTVSGVRFGSSQNARAAATACFGVSAG